MKRQRFGIKSHGGWRKTLAFIQKKIPGVTDIIHVTGTGSGEYPEYAVRKIGPKKFATISKGPEVTCNPKLGVVYCNGRLFRYIMDSERIDEVDCIPGESWEEAFEYLYRPRKINWGPGTIPFQRSIKELDKGAFLAKDSRK